MLGPDERQCCVFTFSAPTIVLSVRPQSWRVPTAGQRPVWRTGTAAGRTVRRLSPAPSRLARIVRRFGIDGQQQPAQLPTRYGSFVAPGGAGTSPFSTPPDVPPRTAGLRADSAGRSVGFRSRDRARTGRRLHRPAAADGEPGSRRATLAGIAPGTAPKRQDRRRQDRRGWRTPHDDARAVHSVPDRPRRTARCPCSRARLPVRPTAHVVRPPRALAPSAGRQRLLRLRERRALRSAEPRGRPRQPGPRTVELRRTGNQLRLRVRGHVATGRARGRRLRRVAERVGAQELDRRGRPAVQTEYGTVADGYPR